LVPFLVNIMAPCHRGVFLFTVIGPLICAGCSMLLLRQLPQGGAKRDGGWGGRRMGYPASEKLEIIRLVEESALPVRWRLENFGTPRPTS
jgi:hypothetical protein